MALTPIPALPDTDRRTTYSVTTTTAGPYSVGFHLYADDDDYENWIEVFVDGVKTDDWTMASASGALAGLARPITNATITFDANLVGTIGTPITVEIVGARRPRRLSQFGNSPSARDFNRAITDLVAIVREHFDKFTRVLRAPGGETLSDLPPAEARVDMLLGFDADGDITLIAQGVGTDGTSMPISYLDTDTALAANSNTKVPSQRAIKTYTDAATAGKAPLASPAFTGNPTAPTQSAGNNSTRIATTAYADAAAAAASGAVTLTGAQTLTNKTLTAPKILTKAEIYPTNAATTADQFYMTGRLNADVGYPVPFLRPTAQNYMGFDLVPNHAGGVVEHTSGNASGFTWMDLCCADFETTPGIDNASARLGIATVGGTICAHFGSWANAGFLANVGSPPVVIRVASTEVARFTAANGFAFKGTTTNDSASAGYAGQVMESEVLAAAAVSLTTATAANVTSLALTAGDWEVCGNIAYETQNGTTTTQLIGYITEVSATAPTIPNKGAFFKWIGSITSVVNNLVMSTGTRRVSIAATTTYYLGTTATFSGGTCKAYGYLRARRIR